MVLKQSGKLRSLSQRGKVRVFLLPPSTGLTHSPVPCEWDSEYSEKFTKLDKQLNITTYSRNGELKSCIYGCMAQ